MLNDYGYKFVAIDPPRYLEKLKKSQKSLGEFWRARLIKIKNSKRNMSKGLKSIILAAFLGASSCATPEGQNNKLAQATAVAQDNNLQGILEQLGVKDHKKIRLAEYEADKNYLPALKSIENLITKLEFLKYGYRQSPDTYSYDTATHMPLGELWKWNGVSFGIIIEGNDKRLLISYKNSETLFYMGRENGASRFEYTINDKRLVTYISLRIAEGLLEKLRTFDNEWQKRPWRELKVKYKKGLPYDQKTKEFVYEGMHSCFACAVLGERLLENKIRYKEKLNKNPQRAVPNVKYDDKYITDGDYIFNNLVKSMYGL